MLHLLHILLWHQAWRLAWHRRWLTDTTHHVLWILITEVTLICLLICTVRCLNAWVNISILLFFYLWWNRLILLYLRLSRCFSHLLYLLEHIKDIVALTLSCIIVSSVIWSLVCGSGMWCLSSLRRSCILFSILYSSVIVLPSWILWPLLLGVSWHHLAIVRRWHTHVWHHWVHWLIVPIWLLPLITLHLPLCYCRFVFLQSKLEITTHHNLIRKALRLVLILHPLNTCMLFRAEVLLFLQIIKLVLKNVTTMKNNGAWVLILVLS